jgi:hypothetical protein
VDIELALELARTEFRHKNRALQNEATTYESSLSPEHQPRKRVKLQILSSDSEDNEPPSNVYSSPSRSKDNLIPTSYAIPVAILKKLEAEKPDLKKDVLVEICRYWALKRGLRRGAPLLKRLHLEVRIYIFGILILNEDQHICETKAMDFECVGLH